MFQPPPGPMEPGEAKTRYQRLKAGTARRSTNTGSTISARINLTGKADPPERAGTRPVSYAEPAKPRWGGATTDDAADALMRRRKV